jgi:LPPG:FO 2-phospho-L-lactate transferase
LRRADLAVADDGFAGQHAVETEDGTLEFQDYFVRRRCEPRVTAVRYANAERATPTAAIDDAHREPHVARDRDCPSNPYLSIDPILAIPALVERPAQSERADRRDLPADRRRSGSRVRLRRSSTSSDCPRTPVAIADHYRGLIDGLVIDHATAHGPSAAIVRRS